MGKAIMSLSEKRVATAAQLRRVQELERNLGEEDRRLAVDSDAMDDL